MQRFPPTSNDRRVGLVAAWGRFPLDVAVALREQGYHVSCLGARDHADPKLAEICNDFRWIGLAKLGASLRYFHRQKVRQVTWAGKFHKTLLYQPWLWLRHTPDWRFIRTFWPHFVSGRKDMKDDSLAHSVIKAFAMEGIEFAPPTDFAPNLLVKAGPLVGMVTASQEADIAFGWQMAKEMGRLDVGQSVCVKERAALAVEAIEGTDECIRRAGKLCRKGGFTVVKVAKPQQDMRFDVPTVGLGTLKSMVESGARVLAIEAGMTIVLDEPDFTSYARQYKLTVVALENAEVMRRAA